MAAPDGPAARGDSALVVAIPEADALVGDLRLEHDPAAAFGVPAHVTILFPFVPAARIDEPVRAQLRGLFAKAAPFAYRFERFARFEETTVYLAPTWPGPFRALTELVCDRWPEHPPYGGAFDEVIPHLTVGDHLAAGTAGVIERETGSRLASAGPVTGHAREVVLLLADAEGRFARDSVYPLGSP